MIELRIPFCFAQEIGLKLTWSDVLQGLDRLILASGFAREKAMEELAINSGAALVDLAISEPGEPVRNKIEKLARSESSSANMAKLLYLSIAYIRRNESTASRLLDLVEEIYADFDHPPHLAKSVRYMPMEGADLGSREANERRLVDNLDGYLGSPPDCS